MTLTAVTIPSQSRSEDEGLNSLADDFASVVNDSQWIGDTTRRFAKREDANTERDKMRKLVASRTNSVIASKTVGPLAAVKADAESGVDALPAGYIYTLRRKTA